MKLEAVCHVTHTDKVPRILADGLLPMQTSNWVRGHSSERYGGGEICAFTERGDAERWASRMEWKFYQGMGVGKVSILTVRAQGIDWQLDTADPLSQCGSRGSWVKCLCPIAPERIVASDPLTLDVVRRLVADLRASG